MHRLLLACLLATCAACGPDLYGDPVVVSKDVAVADARIDAYIDMAFVTPDSSFDAKACTDEDGDGFSTDCSVDSGIFDCDDSNPNVWVSCDSCVDEDEDSHFAGCDAYQTIPGPDCDDSNTNAWASCETCIDYDRDEVHALCDRYETVTGPDCNDNDRNNQTSCDTCVDTDGDGVFVDCDNYITVYGPDCDNTDPNNWLSCATCVDNDSDGRFVGCDKYETIPGPDCLDSNPAIHNGVNEIPGNGIDDDCDARTPDSAECTYTPVPSTNPEPGLLAGITAEHNRWRALVGVQPLSWNPNLAISAQSYADRCTWIPSEFDDRSPSGGFFEVGENILLSTQMPNSKIVLLPVRLWANERFLYPFGTVVSRMNVGRFGHYTQLVWADTTDVGCGYRYCPNFRHFSGPGTIVVCRYGHSGNVLQQSAYPRVVGQCLDQDNDGYAQSVDANDTDRAVQ